MLPRHSGSAWEALYATWDLFEEFGVTQYESHQEQQYVWMGDDEYFLQLGRDNVVEFSPRWISSDNDPFVAPHLELTSQSP